ncbi:ABC transporter permease [Aeromicrobium sp. UC242_57]|uniref:ABC transporter permease n=1 Tax=Aeromicrobium sp. UC242_57 TaxID=3374624 RepID=UPI0037BDAD77
MTTTPEEKLIDSTATPKDATPSAGTGGDAPGARRSPARLRAARHVQSSVTLVAFLVLFAAFAIWLGGEFVNASARVLNIHQNAPILLLALAALVTLTAGMFDLSIASMATLTTFLTIGLRTEQDLGIGLILLICCAVGILGGLLNGILVEVLGINTFIATLGSGGLFLGASSVYSGGAQIAPAVDGPTLPSWFLEFGLFTQKCPDWLLIALMVLGAVATALSLGRWKPRSVPTAVWWSVRGVIGVSVLAVELFVIRAWFDAISVLVASLIAVTFLLWVLLQQISYGRYLRAVGSNRAAASLAGVSVQRTVIQAFVLGGFLAGLSGVVLGATQSVAVPNVAVSYLLPAFAAAFLSTVVLSSSQFTVWGTLIGGVFLVWVSQALILGGLSPTWSDIVNGAVLVVAVGMSSVLNRVRT